LLRPLLWRLLRLLRLARCILLGAVHRLILIVDVGRDLSRLEGGR
jgi:hypothetical protein